jgi:hypothetical protein
VVTASIGIALATTALDPDQFLRNARAPQAPRAPRSLHRAVA